MRPFRSHSFASYGLKLASLSVVMALAASANRQVAAQEPDVSQLVQTVKQVDRFGAGHRQASDAVAQLSRLPASRVIEILAWMNDGVSPLAANWLRGAVEASVDRDPDAVPVDELIAFLDDHSQGFSARSLAFDLIVDRRPEIKEELIAGFQDDPCLELRFMAIDRGMTRIKALNDAGQSEEATGAYAALLENARHPDQVNAIADALEKLGSPVDLTEHYGFITRWSLIGPFDNRDKIGFDAAYAPETAVELEKPCAGKEGDVSWQIHESTAPFGMIDLNTAIGKHMGAVAYATTTVSVDRETTLDIRLGSPNGNQVWVNGQQVISNHVYHAGNSIDQHRAQVTLRPGTNRILVKICQNEQTDAWAQEWQFQLRLCDASGKAIVLPE